MGTHKQLEVWKNSVKLTVSVYKLSVGFPKHELFSLTNQMRRAAVSIPAIISEGSARLTPKEFHYFLRVAFGSLSELETLLLIAYELGYLKTETHDIIHKQIVIVTAQLSGLMRAIQRKIRTAPSL